MRLECIQYICIFCACNNNDRDAVRRLVSASLVVGRILCGAPVGVGMRLLDSTLDSAGVGRNLRLYLLRINPQPAGLHNIMVRVVLST